MLVAAWDGNYRVVFDEEVTRLVVREPRLAECEHRARIYKQNSNKKPLLDQNNFVQNLTHADVIIDYDHTEIQGNLTVGSVPDIC